MKKILQRTFDFSTKQQPANVLVQVQGDNQQLDIFKVG